MINLWKKLALSSESLGWMRRGLGVLAALDALSRVSEASFYLSDLGVLPRSLYYSFFEQSWSWSLYQLSGYPEFCVLMLFLATGLGVVQAAGRSRRWTRVLLWVLVLSVQNRNPAIIDASDDLLRLLLFWDIFLPEYPAAEESSVTPATIGFQFQLSIVLLMWARSLSVDGVGVACQWGGQDIGLELGYLLAYFRVSLLFLALAVWVSPLRLAALILVAPALLLYGTQLHALFPCVLAVGLASLFPCRGGEPREFSFGTGAHSAVKFGVVMILSTFVVALNLVQSPKLRRVIIPPAQALGMLQDWSRVYPISSRAVTEVVARFSGNPIWSGDRLSSRRDRLYVQRVGESPSWAVNLGSALVTQYRLPGGVQVWMQKESLSEDFRLGRREFVLLSPTPVNSETQGLVNP